MTIIGLSSLPKNMNEKFIFSNLQSSLIRSSGKILEFDLDVVIYSAIMLLSISLFVDGFISTLAATLMQN